jgi:hypothetical protein
MLKQDTTTTACPVFVDEEQIEAVPIERRLLQHCLSKHQADCGLKGQASLEDLLYVHHEEPHPQLGAQSLSCILFAYALRPIKV